MNAIPAMTMDWRRLILISENWRQASEVIPAGEERNQFNCPVALRRFRQSAGEHNRRRQHRLSAVADVVSPADSAGRKATYRVPLCFVMSGDIHSHP
jgi:hypothetical protein